MGKASTNHTKHTFFIFWQHILKLRTLGAATTVLFILAIAPGLLVPRFYKEFFDLLSANNVKNLSVLGAALSLILIKILVANLGKTALWSVAAMGGNRFSSKIAASLTNACFDHLLARSQGFFNTNQIGSIIQKISRFIRSFEQLYDEFVWKWLPLVIESIATFFVITYTSKLLGLILFAWMVVFCAVSYVFARIKLPYDLAYSASRSSVTGLLVDSIANHDAITLFSGQSQEKKSFHTATSDQFSLKIFSENIGEFFGAIQSAMIFALEFAIYFFALRLWQQDLLTIGDFIMIQGYLLMMFKKLIEFQKLFRNVFKYIAYAEEMTEILVQQPEIVDAPYAYALTTTNGAIAFNNVSFGYKQPSSTLKNINLSINCGEHIALVGSSGSGKSTLIKLLLRFFEINQGSITIDGQDIRNIQHKSLCDQISIVPQDPLLFHRSVMENIRYGKPDASDEEVMWAATQANCLEFINQLPLQFNEIIGERGMTLSGGQRQRIAIARAILKNAPILVLDEATNSLDPFSEALVREAIRRLIQNKTTISIVHQLTSTIHCDRIVVIHNGSVVEEGKHADLVTKEGYYQSLWITQNPHLIISQA